MKVSKVEGIFLHLPNCIDGRFPRLELEDTDKLSR
jgi:hypothetical protein